MRYQWTPPRLRNRTLIAPQKPCSVPPPPVTIHSPSPEITWQHRWVFPIFKVYINRIEIVYIILLLASLTQQHLCEIYQSLCIVSLTCLSCWVLLYCMNILWFLHPTADRHLGCFHFRAVMVLCFFELWKKWKYMYHWANLRCTMCQFDTFLYCNMIAIVGIISISITYIMIPSF